VYCVWQVVKTTTIISNNPVFISFVRVSGKILKLSLYNPQRPAFITEEASVYCTVRPGPLNRLEYVSSLNCYSIARAVGFDDTVERQFPARFVWYVSCCDVQIVLYGIFIFCAVNKIQAVISTRVDSLTCTRRNLTTDPTRWLFYDGDFRSKRYRFWKVLVINDSSGVVLISRALRWLVIFSSGVRREASASKHSFKWSQNMVLFLP